MTISKKLLKEYYEKQGKDIHHQKLQYASEQFLHSRIVRKALVEFLLDKLILSEELPSFLDVGCSEGWYVDYAAKNAILSISIDLSKFKIRRDYGKKRGYYSMADGECLPFKDASFDVVLCSETLEHLPNPKICMTELFRVSTRYIVITTPIRIHTPWESIKHKIGIAKEKPVGPENFSDKSFKGHIQEPDLKTLTDWLSNDEWQNVECFITGQAWFEKLESLKQASLVIDFPFIIRVRRLLRKVYRRLSILLDKPSFMIIVLKKRKNINK